MNKKLFFFSLSFLSSFLFSQDYKSKLGKATCDCVQKIDFNNADKETIMLKFGTCAFTSSKPYAKEIKRDYNIDLDKDLADPKKMEKFGMEVGLMMLGECTEVFKQIIDNPEQEQDDVVSEQFIAGKIVKIEKGNFIVFHLVGENRVLNKFYWLTTIESTLDLPKEYSSLLNKNVTISYYSAEIFDASINDYKNVNIISSLKTEL